MDGRVSKAVSAGLIKGNSNRRRRIPRVAYAIHSEGLNNSNISAVSAVSMNIVVLQSSPAISQFVTQSINQSISISSINQYKQRYQSVSAVSIVGLSN
jgi:hypothetical protein